VIFFLPGSNFPLRRAITIWCGVITIQLKGNKESWIHCILLRFKRKQHLIQ